MSNQSNSIRYDYLDENNNILFTKIRTVDPITKSKSFYSGHEVDGNFINNLENTRKVLYRLPEILQAINNNQTIYLVEGEKDVETLMKHGLVATTTHSTSYWSPEFTTILKDADVVILFDYDKAGFERKERLIKKLTGNVKQLRYVDLVGMEYTEKHGKDVSDWLDEMGYCIEQLITLTKIALNIEPLPRTNNDNLFKEMSLQDFVNHTFPPQEMLLAPILPSQGLMMLVAKRGVGKTHVALGIAYAVATGGKFLRWSAPTRKKVLYIDGEMPGALMQERLNRMIISTDDIYEGNYFAILSPDLQNGPMPDLSLKEGRDAIEHIVQDYDLIIIDNISCLFRSGGENDAECWQEAQEWALHLRRLGKSILLVHHAGKSGNQRGTSKKEDILDTVITLKQPDDYASEQGACFEIIFNKARRFSGEDAMSFSVQLTEDSNHKWQWEFIQSTEDQLIEDIAAMRNKKFTLEQITTETNQTKSQIETLIKKAKRKGLITSN